MYHAVKILFSLQNINISQRERECYMDLRPFMNPAPYTVMEVCIHFFDFAKIFLDGNLTVS